MNNEFSENFRKIGHKYYIDILAIFQGAIPNGVPIDREVSLKKGFANKEDDNIPPRKIAPPINKTASEALE